MSTIVSVLKKVLPAPAKSLLKHLYLSVLDLSDIAQRKQRMVPPRTMIFVGDGDFIARGLEFRKLLTEKGGLRPGDHVLDVGCRIGRMAVPLTSYLSAQGEYQGFDIVKLGIDWCQKNISPRFPNFHFSHSDIKTGSIILTVRCNFRLIRFPIRRTVSTLFS